MRIVMTPPRDYTLKELAEDVRTLIAFLRENGVVGLEEGIDFHAVTVLTEDGEVEVDLEESGLEVEVPPSILRKIRWYSGGTNFDATSWQEPID